MYSLAVSPYLDSVFQKLAKRNKKQFEIIMKKTNEIVNNPHHYKNLRAPLNDLKRVHIDNSFVLVFSVDEASKLVTLVDFDHHDNIYKKR